MKIQDFFQDRNSMFFSKIKRRFLKFKIFSRLKTNQKRKFKIFSRLKTNQNRKKNKIHDYIIYIYIYIYVYYIILYYIRSLIGELPVCPDIAH